ncbi:MAG: polyprenyl synthetase family protein [Pseudomonadota bacterium]
MPATQVTSRAEGAKTFADPADTSIASTDVPPPATTAPGTELQRLFALVQDDFDAVNALIPRQLTSDVEMVEAIGRYIVDSGGKRLRPLIVLLAARAGGYTGAEHVRLAAIIEFLHTATLLHDDVVDRSALRRGRSTANALWGNAPSVLVGDFLYSRAFQLMVELENMDVMAILADATNIIAEGEVLQLANIGDADLSEASYFEVIRCKTAMLFQAAAHSAGVLSGIDAEQIASLRDYGAEFGVAYQLVDDWLDYAGDPQTMGKNVGDDLAEGKATLPLIRTMANGSAADADLVRRAISTKSSDDLEAVFAAVRRSGALEDTRVAARSAAERAIGTLLKLPANPYRDALEDLARAAVARVS